MSSVRRSPSLSRRGYRKIQITENLLCKNACGYYANPEWEGFCSKCYRDHRERNARKNFFHPSYEDTVSSSTSSRSKSSTAEARGRSSSHRPTTLSVADSSSGASSMGARSFSSGTSMGAVSSEKWNKQKRKVKEIFRSPHKTSLASSSSPSLTALDSDLKTNVAFEGFLQSLQTRQATDLSQFIRNFQDEILCTADLHNMDDLTDKFKTFYEVLQKRLQNHAVFSRASSDAISEIMDHAEKVVLTEVHKALFPVVFAEYEDKDLAIQNRIRELHWVTAHLLDCGIQERKPGVRVSLDKAITDILEMDSKRAPQDKLACLVRCCKGIFRTLQLSAKSVSKPPPETLPAAESESRSTPPGTPSTPSAVIAADDFLPALIYVVLKGNPPLLHSNMGYITRFSNPSRLMTGEAGYYFTNLCASVAFLERMDASSLGLTEEEFDCYMSGQYKPLDDGGVCEPVESLRLGIVELQNLAKREEEMGKEFDRLEKEFKEFERYLENEVNDILIRTPFEFVKSNIEKLKK
ncbi:unnamed protein product, partial [Cyprideis torosa]